MAAFAWLSVSLPSEVQHSFPTSTEWNQDTTKLGCTGPSGGSGPCLPGNEYCAAPFSNAPAFHLMDQHGCGENDPNGPVFDPVHGVIHHFYQIHLAAPPGHGPDYGHFVSKDFLHWAPMPVAIWNGIDASATPSRSTPYDNEAIFTGSAVVVDGAGPHGARGVVQIYPGLCNKDDWPSCATGTLLAQAVPANYEADELLTNWTKPSYNPIVENTQRDPSSPWKTPSGEWRLRTYDSKFYGAASDADMLAGKWYFIGVNPMFRTCECPSFYPLPAATPGFEKAYLDAQSKGTLPTHVHKTSCSGDWWQVGTYVPGAPKQLDNFTATPQWEDMWAQRPIDVGKFYASKDNEYPTLNGGVRRINWGWGVVPPDSVQTLPREITFNAVTHTLEQRPIDELRGLRAVKAARHRGSLGGAPYDFTPTANLSRVVKQSELVIKYTLPPTAAKLSIKYGPAVDPPAPVSTYMPATDLAGHDYNITHFPANTDPSVCEAACAADDKCKAWTYVVRGSPAGEWLALVLWSSSGDCCLKSAVPCPVSGRSACTSGAKSNTTAPCYESSVLCEVDYAPPDANATADYYEVPVFCGDFRDSLRLARTETSLEVRIFADWTIMETYFQQGRVAITSPAALDDDAHILLSSSARVSVDSSLYSVKSIWTTPDAVRAAPRVYK
ncbi:hypothetical protein AB1Y20_003231 [Prymnesium parvum]|uniref:Glycosyl hydrolase family 32 N-terminal domain-containing protein n=1 Tax=Prymnesium parvum TaxID=97485 RepID=A0AB34JBF9_PRYPA